MKISIKYLNYEINFLLYFYSKLLIIIQRLIVKFLIKKLIKNS
jgi:hypothetical protein